MQQWQGSDNDYNFLIGLDLLININIKWEIAILERKLKKKAFKVSNLDSQSLRLQYLN